jgi:uncharacterized membrane protein
MEIQKMIFNCDIIGILILSIIMSIWIFNILKYYLTICIPAIRLDEDCVCAGIIRNV